MKQVALLLIALLFVSCAYQVNLTADSSAEEFARADSLMRDKPATLILADSTRLRASHYVFRADSVFYVNLVTGGPRAIPARDVDRVLYVDHAPTAWRGAVIGAIPGATVGFVLAVMLGSIRDVCDDCRPHRTQWEILLPTGFLTGALIGGGAGALIGAAAAPVYTVDYSPQK